MATHQSSSQLIIRCNQAAKYFSPAQVFFFFFFFTFYLCFGYACPWFVFSCYYAEWHDYGWHCWCWQLLCKWLWQWDALPNAKMVVNVSMAPANVLTATLAPTANPWTNAQVCPLSLMFNLCSNHKSDDHQEIMVVMVPLYGDPVANESEWTQVITTQNNYAYHGVSILILLFLFLKIFDSFRHVGDH